MGVCRTRGARVLEIIFGEAVLELFVGAFRLPSSQQIEYAKSMFCQHAGQFGTDFPYFGTFKFIDLHDTFGSGRPFRILI